MGCAPVDNMTSSVDQNEVIMTKTGASLWRLNAFSCSADYIQWAPFLNNLFKDERKTDRKAKIYCSSLVQEAILVLTQLNELELSLWP